MMENEEGGLLAFAEEPSNPAATGEILASFSAKRH
jgi:hypothetical protein